MSTSTDKSAPTKDGKETTDSTSGGGDAFKPIGSQEELNEVIKDRLARERAKFGDYDDLKAKAARLDEIEQANQSELERATGAAKAAETERDKARAEALRLRVAVEHGITVEDADLFLTGTDEETLRAQAKRLADREADRKKAGNHVPREGTGSSGNAATDELRDFTRGLFGANP